ncbi:MAG: hypothetical protein HKP40_08335, partial [Litoreibacter sp.]|nr:hypothetical protein [Litoreibacter sp.]
TGPVALDPGMDLAMLRARIETEYDFALRYDFDDTAETAQFWYVSEEKQEPRLGRRYEEPGADLESPLDIARQVQDLYRDLEGQSGGLAQFL